MIIKNPVRPFRSFSVEVKFFWNSMSLKDLRTWWRKGECMLNYISFKVKFINKKMRQFQFNKLDKSKWAGVGFVQER